MQKVNGIILPGGKNIGFIWKNKNEEYLREYVKTLQFIFDEFVHLNSIEGTYFPIWGVCQGFQQTLAYFSDLTAKSIKVENQKVSKNLDFQNNFENSRFSKYLTETNFKQYTEQEAAFFSHNYAFSEKGFLSNKKLNESIYLIATNITEDDKKIVSIIEGKK